MRFSDWSSVLHYFPEGTWMHDDRFFYFFFHKDLVSNDLDKNPQRFEKEFDVKQKDNVGEVLGGDTALIDENGNILKRNSTTMIKTDAGDVVNSDTAEPLVSKEESLGSEKMLTERIFSSHDARERTRTSLEQQIPTPSSQGNIPEGRNNLLETENYQEVSKPFLKCKYA